MGLRFDNPLVAELLEKQAGDGSFKVVRILKQPMTDEQISRRLKQDVNETRATLNKLHYLGVINYNKKKAEDSNWYTYTWFLKRDRITELFANRYKDELEELEKKLSFEKTYQFFKCSGNSCARLPFELACEYDFKCPECGNPMDAVSNGGERRKLGQRIKQLKSILGKGF